MKYEKSINLFRYSRIKTQSVQVGSVGIGGDNPIRIQSMMWSLVRLMQVALGGRTFSMELHHGAAA